MSKEYTQVSTSTEEDVVQKIVVPYLENLGFRKSDMDFEFPIKAQIGSGKAKTVFADIVVKSSGRAIMIIEVKKSDHRLEERDKEQAISYARLFDPKPINFAIVTNGNIWQAYRADTKERIPKVPSQKTWSQILADYKLTTEQKEEANYIAVEGYETSGEIIKDLKKCHDFLYSHDGLEPLQTFQEINKFIFIKIQEERAAKKHGRDNRFSTEYLENKNIKVSMQSIFREAVADFPEKIDQIFTEKDSIEVSAESILKIVSILEKRSLTATGYDLLGTAYEEFLSPVFRNKHLGSYFTPRTIVDFMIDFLQPQIGALVIDPAYGSGGFLVRIFQRLKDKILGTDYQTTRKTEDLKLLSSEWIYGTEISPNLSRACRINMYIHGDGKTKVYNHDGLKNCGDIAENKFDLVITNPPFGGVIVDTNLLEHYDLGSNKKRQLKEVLFLERCIRLAKPSGKIGIILPDGILTNSSLQEVRDYILRKCKILGIVSLPNHTFAASGAGVKASILFLEKKEQGVDYSDYDIFMAEVEKVGYDATGRPDESEFGDVLDKHYEFISGNRGKDSNLFFLNSNELTARFDPYFNKPFFDDIKKIEDSCKYEMKVLSEISSLVVDGIHKKPEYSKNGLPFIQVNNISKGHIDFSKNIKFVSNKWKREVLKRYTPQKGDVLITKDGTIGIAATIEKIPKLFSIFVSVAAIRPNKNLVLPKYLEILLNSEFGQKQILRSKRGAALVHLLLEEIRKLSIPIPPFNVQNKIILDFKKHDKKIAEYECNIKKLQKEKAEFLAKKLGFTSLVDKKKLIFLSKLSAFSAARFDPNYYQSKYRQAEEILGQGKFPLRKIRDITTIKKGIEVGSTKYAKEGIPFIRVADISSKGINLNTNKKISQKTFEKLKQYQPKKDELLFSKDGTVGICTPTEGDIKGIISGGILRVLPKKEINLIFLCEILNSPVLQTIFERESVGAVIKHYSVEKFKKTNIPFPPLAEQNKIVKQLETYSQRINRLREKIQREKKAQNKVLNILF